MDCTLDDQFDVRRRNERTIQMKISTILFAWKFVVDLWTYLFNHFEYPRQQTNFTENCDQPARVDSTFGWYVLFYYYRKFHPFHSTDEPINVAHNIRTHQPARFLPHKSTESNDARECDGGKVFLFFFLLRKSSKTPTHAFMIWYRLQCSLWRKYVSVDGDQMELRETE